MLFLVSKLTDKSLQPPHHPLQGQQPEQKKNKENRRQSQTCSSYAEVHPVEDQRSKTVIKSLQFFDLKVQSGKAERTASCLRLVQLFFSAKRGVFLFESLKSS